MIVPVLFNCKCTKCNTIFRAAAGSGFSYGDFVLNSRSKINVAYLNALEDLAFNEIMKIIDNDKRCQKLTNKESSKILYKTFSKIVDTPIENDPLEIGIICPSCGSEDIDWRETNPQEYYEGEVLNVTHKKWDLLSQEEKISLVDESIKELRI